MTGCRPFNIFSVSVSAFTLRSSLPMTPSTPLRRALAGALVAAAVSFPAGSAAAQKSHAAAGDRDMQTLSNYRLTESALRKYYKAMGNVTKAVMKDTSLAQTLDDAGASDDADIATIAAKYDHVPVLKTAIAAAAFTSTEFATFSLSYMQAVMAYGLMTQGPESLRIKELPKGTPKENVDFVRMHQQLIQQLDAELKALQPSGSDVTGSSNASA
jgi:hypothetical protein